MKISLIVAMASNRIIGMNQTLPWHLSADLKRFKKITWGKPILMGRKTHESIRRPLPERKNIIISRNPDYQSTGCEVFNAIQPAIASCQDADELFVIGGASFYHAMLASAEVIYLTKIHQPFKGDTSFPELNVSEWQEIEREDIHHDPQVAFTYSFITLQRR